MPGFIIERSFDPLIVAIPEIDSNVADSGQAIILDQVLNGVATRMAILYLLLSGKTRKDT